MQAAAKKEVSCKALDLLFQSVKLKKIEEQVLLKGIPYASDYLKNKRERVEWWVWCRMVSNIKPFFTQQEFEEMGRSFVKRGKYLEGLLWAFFLFTSTKFAKIFYKQIFHLADSMFSCIKQNTEFLSDNNIRITAYWDGEYEHSPEWSFICKGVWEQLGLQIRQKGFKIEMTIAPRKTIFDVSWTIEKFTDKLKRRFLWFLSLNKALTELADSRDELLYHYNKLQSSQKLLQKQTTQLKTAYEISTSIRQSLNINDTLKRIADALVNEAGFSAAFIELCKDIDEKVISIKFQSGAVFEFVTPMHQEINVNDNKIGDLIVYPKPEIDIRESDELLEYLTPVINIAIHDALVLRAVTDYRDNLEQKVLDRTSELRRARDELTKTNELLQESQNAQNRFFTNISHEFRTPLTLILDPSRQLIEQATDEKVKDKLNLIHRSARKLNKLVNELLDLSSIEAGEMKLKTCPLNIIFALKEISFPFYSLAERKKISFKVKSEVNEIIAYIDKPKLDKILTNLLSNAFKFTPEGGAIELSVNLPTPSVPFPGGDTGAGQKSKIVMISICDTGIGIPKAQLEKIFDRFYQVDGGHTREHEGTGIGLSLTKELVELHKAKIEVESEEGKGSIFRLIFPLGKEHLKPEEIYENEKESAAINKLVPELEEIAEKPIYETDFKFPELDGLSSILIVEDNSDVRNYIRMIFESHYKIIEANDGEEGTGKAFETIPDIIISDVMMPKLDGFQLCKILKNDSRTSHIPIIMLTAKATMKDKLSGFDLGADEYIMKPFEAEELKSRIKNLLEQRKRLHEHFRKFGFFDFEKEKISSMDEQFLKKAVAIINEHISDSLFGVEVFAEDMFVSRSLLIKKIEALIGQPPSEMIKRIRLAKAAKLIESKSANISEIALEVGFSSPSYFAECFKKQFGVSPSQYHNKS